MPFTKKRVAPAPAEPISKRQDVAPSPAKAAASAHVPRLLGAEKVTAKFKKAFEDARLESAETQRVLAAKVTALDSEVIELKRDLAFEKAKARKKKFNDKPDALISAPSDDEDDDPEDGEETHREIRAYSTNKKTAVARSLTWANKIKETFADLFGKTNDPASNKRDALVRLLRSDEYRDVFDELIKQSGLREKIAKECAENIEKLWRVELGTAIKSQMQLSDAQYQSLIHKLSALWKPIDEKGNEGFVICELLEGTGVKFPSMGKNASVRQVKKHQAELIEAFGPEESQDQKSFTLSMDRYLEHCIKRDASLLEGVRVVIGGDGATLRRGTSQVTFCVDVLPQIDNAFYAIPEGEEPPPADAGAGACNFIMSLLCYEGGEKREELEVRLERFLEEARKLKEGGSIRIELNGEVHNVPVTFVLCVDKKMKCLLLGHAGSGAGIPCDCCTAPKDKLHICDDKKYKDRTIKSTFLAAHLPYPGMPMSEFPYQCKHCKKVFESADEMTNEPQPDLTEHHQTHVSQRFHVAPLFDFIPLDDWLEDYLHYLLRNSGSLLKYTILNNVVTEEMEKELTEFMHAKTGCYVRYEKVGKGENAETFRTASFIGREAKVLLCHISKVIDIVLPPGVASEANRQLVQEAWSSFLELWTLICEPWADQKDATREKRAIKVKAASKKYVMAFAAAADNSKVTVYVHDSYHHLPKQIRKHGNLWDISCEKAEALHARKRRNHISNTNKKGNVPRQLVGLEIVAACSQLEVKMRPTKNKNLHIKEYTRAKLEENMPKTLFQGCAQK
jgi:hypothetical protein